MLVLGNKLNGITAKARKGIVKAFTANSLHQLHLTKSFDGSCSVLQYLLRLLKKRDPDLLALSKVSDSAWPRPAAPQQAHISMPAVRIVLPRPPSAFRSSCAPASAESCTLCRL